MRFLLDLDEVLVDFVGGICDRYDISKDILLEHWEEGKWDIVPPLDRTLRTLIEPGTVKTFMDTNSFWRNLDGDAKFWYDLKWHPWAEELLDLVSRRPRSDWLIVTSPSQCLSSYTGKLKWARDNLNGEPYRNLQRIRLSNSKTEFARPDTVLIDDNEATVTKFRTAGGRAILFPAYHNSLHKERHAPLTYVKDQIRNLDRPMEPNYPGIGHSY